MILLRLLGIGAIYGLGFMFVKSLFPEPFALLVLQGGGSSEGNLTVLSLVYMGVGLISGLIAAPLFGGLLLLRRGDGEASQASRLTLSLVLALLMGVISGILTLVVYAYRYPAGRRRARPPAPDPGLRFPDRTPVPRRLDHRPRPPARRTDRALPLARGRRPAAAPLRRRTPARAEALRSGRL